MAGLAPAGADRAALRATYVANLAWAAAQAAPQGVDVLIEPINTRDIPGFFLNRQDHAHEVVAEVGAANLKVQMDLYHCQIVEGDLAKKIEKYLPAARVGHLQIAGVPERHEPDVGEVNYRLPVRPDRSPRLQRLDRLRVPTSHHDTRRHLGRPRLVSTLPESTTMKLLITGGAGFVGARLARTLLARGTLAGQRIDSLVLADQFAPPADLLADPRVGARTGPLLDQCAGLGAERFDGVFHLASAVSGECELDFDLGMRSNLDSTRALLDAIAPRPATRRASCSRARSRCSAPTRAGRCPTSSPTTRCRRRKPPTARRS